MVKVGQIKLFFKEEEEAAAAAMTRTNKSNFLAQTLIDRFK